jgi:hypothetical protein
LIALRPDLKVVLAAQPVDFRKSVHTLSALVSEALRANPYCGDVFVFRSKRAEHATFCIQSSKRDDCVSVASPFWTEASSRAVPTRQGIEVHLHGRTEWV